MKRKMDSIRSKGIREKHRDRDAYTEKDKEVKKQLKKDNDWVQKIAQ